MKDRVSRSPGRYSARVSPEDFANLQNGKEFPITLVRDDDPEVEGTPYSKAAVLPDSIAEVLCPGVEDPTPADAFAALADCSKNMPLVYTATPDTLANVIKTAVAGATVQLTAGEYGLLKLRGQNAYPENCTIIGSEGVTVDGISITSGVGSGTLSTNTDISNATLPRGLTLQNLTFTSEFSLRNARIDDMTLDGCHFEVGAGINITPNHFEDNYGADHGGKFLTSIRPDYAQLYPENIVVKNCTIENSNHTSAAIYILGCGSVTLCNNTINGSAYDGIQIAGLSSSPYFLDVRGKITITGNKISNAASRSINMVSINDSEVSVYGNKLYSCGVPSEAIRIRGCANTEVDFGGGDVLHVANTYNNVAISVGNGILVADTVIPFSQATQKALNQKADKTTMQTALDLKADKTTMQTALNQKADKTTMQTALNQKADKTTMQTALDLKMDKVAEVYNSNTDIDETNLNAWLDTIVSAMPNDSVRNVSFGSVAIARGARLVGTIRKYRDDYVTVDLTEQGNGYHHVKVKTEGVWQNTVWVNGVYDSGELYTAMFTPTQHMKFYIVEVRDEEGSVKDTFAIDANTIPVDDSRYYTRTYPTEYEISTIGVVVSRDELGIVVLKSGFNTCITRVVGYA